MKIFTSIILIYIIEIATISFAQNGEKGLCSKLFEDFLPKWLLRWRSSDYGLEFTTKPNSDNKISAIDKGKEETYNKQGPGMIREMIIEHLSKIEKNESQFDIERVDPIEYEDPSGTRMWLILKNISFFNLDTFDPDSINYHRSGRREYGVYQLPQDVYDNIETLKSTKKSAQQFLKKINEKTRTYKRADTVWDIKVSAEFKSGISSREENDSLKKNTSSKEPESSVKPEDKPMIKPIVVKAEFKIQPQKNENESSSSTSNAPEPLRASGVLKLNVYDFDFELTIIERHIDPILRENLPENKRCKNRVPDFDVKYGIEQLEIEEIKLTKYDRDEEWQTEPESDLEDVMDNVSEAVDETDTETVPKRSKKIYNYIKEDTSMKVKEVKEHLDILRQKILDFRSDEIRKRLCINIMPKMSWKTMQMESKRQLPGLIRQIVQYDENFKRKSYPPKASSISMMSMAKTAFIFGQSFGKLSIGGLFSSDGSAANEKD